VGNKAGWIIAGVIVLVIGAIVVKVVIFPSPTDPTSTTRAKGFMDELPTDTSLALLTGTLPGGSGNAGDDYKAALDAITRHKVIFDAFEKVLARDRGQGERDLVKGELAVPADVIAAWKEIAAHLKAGASKGSFEYTLKHTPATFEVGYRFRGTVDLINIQQTLARLVWFHLGQKDYDAAIDLQKDLIVMGWHMGREGARLHMTDSGLAFQGQLAGDLARFYFQGASKVKETDADKAQKYTDASDQVKKFMQSVGMARSRLRAVNHVFASTKIPIGDILNIAEKHKDRAVRVQAILFLGRLRFEISGHRGDTRYTKKLIDQYASSSDPFEAAAAKAARDLTEDGWKKVYEREMKMN